MDNINIFGTGGFAKEVYGILKKQNIKINSFVSDIITKNYIYDIKVINDNEYDPSLEAVVAIGNPKIRNKVVNKILKKNANTIFPNVIDQTSILLNFDTIRLGCGIIICSNVIITCDVTINNFVNLNLNTTIGHDCYLGQYFTTAPGVNISGNVHTGNRVYFGTNSSCKEQILINDDITVGMGSVVCNDLKEKNGTYIGIPSKIIKKDK